MRNQVLEDLTVNQACDHQMFVQLTAHRKSGQAFVLLRLTCVLGGFMQLYVRDC